MLYADAPSGVTWPDLYQVAREGLIAGGARRESAFAIVAAASQNFRPLRKHRIIRDDLARFKMVLDAELLAYVRVHGDGAFVVSH